MYHYFLFSVYEYFLVEVIFSASVHVYKILRLETNLDFISLKVNEKNISSYLT